MAKAIVALKLVRSAKKLTEFFASITEKWYQLPFHSTVTTTCLLSDYSLRQKIRALSTTECC
jgi:hypothetical protein